jgi:hypothetical protein
MVAKKLKSKPKQKPKITRELRTIEAERTIGVSETGETFAHVLVKIVRRRIAATGK